QGGGREEARQRGAEEGGGSQAMSTHSMMCRVAVLLAVAMVAACTPGESTHEWVAREKAKKGAPLQPLPVVKTFENFLYTAQEDRDPFGYSLEEQEQDASSGPRPDQNRPRES